MSEEGEENILRMMDNVRQAHELSDGALVDAVYQHVITCESDVTSYACALIDEITERFMAVKRIAETPGGIILHGGDPCDDTCDHAPIIKTNPRLSIVDSAGSLETG